MIIMRLSHCIRFGWIVNEFHDLTRCLFESIRFLLNQYQKVKWPMTNATSEKVERPTDIFAEIDKKKKLNATPMHILDALLFGTISKPFFSLFLFRFTEFYFLFSLTERTTETN